MAVGELPKALANAARETLGGAARGGALGRAVETLEQAPEGLETLARLPAALGGGASWAYQRWRQAETLLSRRNTGPFGRALALLPRLSREGVILDQHVREGRFQRSLAVITALSGVAAGIEAGTEHYRGSYSQRIMYSPIALGGLLSLVSGAAVFNRWAARVALPIVSAVTLADGVVGFIFHVRGIARKPGGWRIPVFNVIMGPPVFAPLLFGITGFLGLITSFLRREDDPERDLPFGLPRARSTWTNLLPHAITHEGVTLRQDIREGRFQRGLALAMGASAFFNGIEALYSHYKNGFLYPIQWTPVLMTPLMMIAGFGAFVSRRMARTWLPVVSLAAIINGGVGFLYHARGAIRRPGWYHRPLYTLAYGPPLFAPLLFAASGMLGLMATLMRRGD